MAKIGRNDPCPCGSGKKYKYCCGGSGGTIIDAQELFAINRLESEMARDLKAYENDPRYGKMSYQETRGTPNAATNTLNQFINSMSGKEFKDEEELQKAFSQFQSAYNFKGEDDFLGLSPEQMHIALHQPSREFERFLEVGKGVVEPDAQSVPILRQVIYLLSYLAEKGPIKTTQARYLPPALAREWYNAAFLNEDPIFKAYAKPEKEIDYFPIGEALDSGIYSGLARLDESGRIWITEEGMRAISEKDFPSLYNKLLFSYIDILGNSSAKRAERMLPFASRIPLFFCRVLETRGASPLTLEDIAGYLKQAFPQGGDDELFYKLLVHQGCVGPAATLGWIEWRKIAENIDDPEPPSIRSEFFKRAIRWKC